ncbi:MAG: hypothetical protein Q4F11_02435 [Eubacteriales bacterium]|nr:hypothetical protein [Eubacteriales bacterium]
MAQERQNYKRVKSSNYSRTAYVSGNTVKKLYVSQPVQRPDVEREDELARRTRKREKARIHRANKLNFLYTIGVSLIVAAIFGICYQYLNLQTSVKNNAAEVSKLEVQYNSLKETNDELEDRINAGINLDDVYDIAVNELGMIYPNKSQVVDYESAESEYVKQYKDISASN